MFGRQYYKKSPKARLGRHFQGEFRATLNPGLKPWAVLYSRFAAKAETACFEPVVVSKLRVLLGLKAQSPSTLGWRLRVEVRHTPSLR
jgi:hypothetical protein